MPKLSNDVNKKIKATAKLLPVILHNTHETHIMTGAEILELGTINEIGGKPINPVIKYTVPMPVQLYRNHERRLKKAYVKSGYAGVQQYVSEVASIVKNSKNKTCLTNA